VYVSSIAIAITITIGTDTPAYRSYNLCKGKGPQRPHNSAFPARRP
jgi:hypothetical protein